MKATKKEDFRRKIMKHKKALTAIICVIVAIVLALAVCAVVFRDRGGNNPSTGSTSSSTDKSADSTTKGTEGTTNGTEGTTQGTDPTESTGTTNPTESTGATDPTEGSTAPTDPTEGSTAPTDPTEPTESTAPPEPTDPTDPTESTSPVQPHEHDYRPSETVEPTCTEGGYTVYRCECGETYSGDETAALGHDYTSVTTNPTCSKEGSVVDTCKVCGDVKTTVLEKKAHDYKTETYPATCLSNGAVVETCKVCGHVETTTIPMIDHAFETETYPATCTESGSVVETCTVCSHMRFTTIPATGHIYTEWMAETEGNCENGGTEYRTCEGCDLRETRTVPVGHSWTDWVLTRPAGGAILYEVTRTCRGCGLEEKETRSIFDCEHDYEYEYVDATCEMDGYTICTCNNCGEVYKTDYHTMEGWYSGMKHDWGEWVTTLEPTTSSAGEKERTCNRCGTVETAVLIAIVEYEPYIDERVTVEKFYGGVSYDYGDKIGVTDRRSWGEPPSIWINDDGSWTVGYYTADGEWIQFDIELPPEGYFYGCFISEDGTYKIVPFTGMG